MKRPAGLLLLAQLILAFPFFACDDDSEDNGYDLYVYGAQNSKGTVWMNGVEQPETLLANFLYGGSTDGKDLYVAGYGVANVTQTPVAKYWKNGSEVVLSDGTKDERAYDVAVSGSDVYAAGFEQDNFGPLKAKYWKNGNEVILRGNPDSSFGIATDVVVSGSDFYVLSWENVGQNDSIVSRVWKNGKMMHLETDSVYTYVEGIAVSGNDVHLVGYESNKNGFRIYKYWKNGIGTFNPHGAKKIAVNGNDIYMTGWGANNNLGIWKNDVFTALTSEYAELVSIHIQGNDVIVAGNLLDNNNHRSGIVWKNGVPVAPFLGTDPTITITGAVGIKK